MTVMISAMDLKDRASEIVREVRQGGGNPGGHRAW
jgi:antitoxin (DNA-binding transcriptional repressor) of toxin-antitoxin stability system